MVTLEAVTPGELKARGSGLQLTAGFSDTPFGRALLASTAARHRSPRLRRAGRRGGGARGAAAAQWPRGAAGARRWRRGRARRGASGSAAAAARAPLRLAVQGTNFQLKVWQALLEAGRAAPTTLRGSSRGPPAAGGAARAVGNAVGANPVAWLIPCHNVLRQDGALGRLSLGRGPQARDARLAGARARPAPRAASARAAPRPARRHNRSRGGLLEAAAVKGERLSIYLQHDITILI